MTITSTDVSNVIRNYFTTRDPSDTDQAGYDGFQYLRHSIMRSICQSLSWTIENDKVYLDKQRAKLKSMEDGAPVFDEWEIRRTQERVFDKEALIGVQEEMLRHFALAYKADSGREFVATPSKINLQQVAARVVANKVAIATPETTSELEHEQQTAPRAIRSGSSR